MADQDSSAIPPSAISLVVCDNVYQASDGKRALVGLFTKITAPGFPARQGKLCVFVSLTNVKGLAVCKCKLEIVHGETEKVVVCAEGPLPERSNPLAVWDLVFEFRNLKFDEPGKYYVRFFGNGHPLLERPFEVMQIPEPGSGEAR